MISHSSKSFPPFFLLWFRKLNARCPHTITIRLTVGGVAHKTMCYVALGYFLLSRTLSPTSVASTSFRNTCVAYAVYNRIPHVLRYVRSVCCKCHSLWKGKIGSSNKYFITNSPSIQYLSQGSENFHSKFSISTQSIPILEIWHWL